MTEIKEKRNTEEIHRRKKEELLEELEGRADFVRAFRKSDAQKRQKEEAGSPEAMLERGVFRAENYLSGYKFCKRILNLKNFEKKYIETLEFEKKFPAEFTLAKAKMFEIRHFVLGLPNSDEKMLLYFHYVRGNSIEKCGEMLGVSRATAFRLKRRALELAYKHSIEINHNLEVL